MMSVPEPVDNPDSSATVLYVGNLDRRVTDVMMTNILRTGLPHIADKILSAKMFSPSDPSQGPEGYCFVQFADNNAACQAMTFLNGREFCGKKVKVNWATNSGTGGTPKIIGSSVTIFVGDLDDDLTDSELRQAFDPFGEILNAKVCRDAATNKSKNYGFISFTNKPDAEKAIREMHGSMLKRRPIKTNWATRNQKSVPTTQLDYDEVYKETAESNCTVYVTNLPDGIAESALVEHFEPYGRIVGSPRIFEGKNFAFIKYDSHAAAATAIVKGNGSDLRGSTLKCWWGKDANTDGGGPSNNSHRSSGMSSNVNTYNPPPGTPQDAMSAGQNPYAGMSQQQYQQYMQYYSYWMQQYQAQQQMMYQQQQGGQQHPSQQGQHPGQPGQDPNSSQSRHPQSYHPYGYSQAGGFPQGGAPGQQSGAPAPPTQMSQMPQSMPPQQHQQYQQQQHMGPPGGYQQQQPYPC